MAGEEQLELLPQEFLEMSNDDFQDFIDGLGPTEAGIMGIEINNTPEVVQTEEIVIGDFEVSNFTTTETTEPATIREYEAFGVKLNDTDDFWSVGMVLAIVVVIYIGKCCIDYFFACALERYKHNKLK